MGEDVFSAFRVFAVRIALALTLSIAGSGCSGDSPTGGDIEPGPNDPSIVVALGDSITFGVMDRYVEVCDESLRGAGGFCPPLQSLSGKTVVNAGVCGEDSYGGVSRIRGVLETWRPGVILIDYSPNDLANGRDAVIGNLRVMIDAARENHTVPIIGTLLPTAGEHSGLNLFIVRLNAQIRALCAEQGLECADHYAAFVHDSYYQASPFARLSADGLHPNHAGYALMAATWARSLRRVY
ncbi:MAG: SGNH/GDSL hydrolase family protein [Candidatus Methylomirabilia bacterium]